MKQYFYTYPTQLAINTANVVGKTSDFATSTQILNDVKDAFQKQYVAPNGRMIFSSQTTYVLALHFGMLSESQRARAAQRLVDNLQQYGNQLCRTGFWETPFYGAIKPGFRLVCF